MSDDHEEAPSVNLLAGESQESPAPKFKWRYVGWLSKFSSEIAHLTLPNGVEIEEGAKVAPLILDLLPRHHDLFYPWADKLWDQKTPPYLLSSTVRQADPDFNPLMPSHEFEDVTSAFRILKSGVAKVTLVAGWRADRMDEAFSAGGASCCDDPWVSDESCCRKMSGVSAPYGPPLWGAEYSLAKNEPDELSSLVESLRCIHRGDPDPIRRALVFFNLSYEALSPHLGWTLGLPLADEDHAGESERLVQLLLSLEALLVTRRQKFIGPAIISRAHSYTGIPEAALEELWAARGDIVHGRRRHLGRPPLAILEMADEAENVARLALKRALLDPPSLAAIRGGSIHVRRKPHDSLN